MTISLSDISFLKSVTVTDTNANGGRKGHVSVISGARHSLFPRVSKAERISGITRYRKEFMQNSNEDDEIAYGVLLFLEFPSNGGDRFAIGPGTQTDTQTFLDTDPPVWAGVGSLFTALSGGETSVQLSMEDSDFIFENGGYLHISDKFITTQTIASTVTIGDSVQYSAGTWQKIASSSDITYPNGIYVGNDTVMSLQTSSNEEWLLMAENLYEDEVIGGGDGSSKTPTLVGLTNGTNGIYAQSGSLPVVTATIGGVARTVDIAADGSCSGYCTAGQLNMDTGAWTTPITWAVAPDNATDITVTYKENCFSYAGNVVTIDLDEQVANSYAVANSYGAGCIYLAELTTSLEDWVENTSVGTYDEVTYPPILYNDGTEYDEFTLTFTSSTTFIATGANEGSVGIGTVTTNFSPINPNTGQPYFTIDKDGWDGSWVSGDSITFTTKPSAIPLWWREIVPSGTAAEPNNVAILGWYLE